MSTISYKNYIGTVEYSEDDECLFGRIIGINDIVTYEAQSVTELRLAFQESVDDYLEHCKELGKEPNKPYSGRFVLRVAPELHADVAMKAQKQGVSLNQYVTSLLAQT